MSDEAPRGWDLWKYQLFGLTPPARYRAWVERDIATPGWLVRQAAQLLGGLALGALLVSRWSSGVSVVALIVGGTLGTAIATVLQGDSRRRRALVYYELRWKHQTERSRVDPRIDPS